MSSAVKSIIPPALVPPGVNDARQAALLEIFGEVLADLDPGALVMTDPMKVDKRFLPYIAVEVGAQDFIDEDMPELVQRRVLKNIWELKAKLGYDAGVKLGLSLLGMTTTIKHWYEFDPMMDANTHRITVEIDELLYPEDGEHFSVRQIDAIWNMINRTKRYSQETQLRIGVTARGKGIGGVYPGSYVKAIATPDIPPPPTVLVSGAPAFVPSTLIHAIAGDPS